MTSQFYIRIFTHTHTVLHIDKNSWYYCIRSHPLLLWWIVHFTSLVKSTIENVHHHRLGDFISIIILMLTVLLKFRARGQIKLFRTHAINNKLLSKNRAISARVLIERLALEFCLSSVNSRALKTFSLYDRIFSVKTVRRSSVQSDCTAKTKILKLIFTQRLRGTLRTLPTPHNKDMQQVVD